MDPETGILYPHASLIGQARHFHLVVEARDGEGNGQFTDHTAIDIEVLDVNQDKPVFIMPALANATVEVPEVRNTVCLNISNKFINTLSSFCFIILSI